MKTHSPQRGFTLMELLVVLVIVAVLAALLVPVLGRVQAQARGTQCSNNMRQLAIAALGYANDHNMSLPVTTHQRSSGGKSWSVTLQEYAGGKIVFRCPADELKDRAYTYVINDFLTPNPAGAPNLDYSTLTKLEQPARTILFGEATQTYANTDHFHFSDYAGVSMPPEILAQQIAVERHLGSANYAFADAHLETLSWAQAQDRLRATGSIFVDPSAPQ
jgi:prepilin-type N-terminal cleavage/methylation domain-containing protein/prepilin-type processing-associated H-X9-DG protein